MSHPTVALSRFLNTGFELPPPFNRWLIFYKPAGKGVEIKRVL